MLTKTKIALAAALFVGTASVAMADGEFDPNLANRYPAYNGPAAHGTFQSAPVALYQGRNVALQGRNVSLYQGGQAFSTDGRPQVHTFNYDSAPVISGGGY
jgi:hypothetical protein